MFGGCGGDGEKKESERSGWRERKKGRRRLCFFASSIDELRNSEKEKKKLLSSSTNTHRQRRRLHLQGPLERPLRRVLDEACWKRKLEEKEERQKKKVRSIAIQGRHRALLAFSFRFCLSLSLSLLRCISTSQPLSTRCGECGPPWASKLREHTVNASLSKGARSRTLSFNAIDRPSLSLTRADDGDVRVVDPHRRLVDALLLGQRPLLRVHL